MRCKCGSKEFIPSGIQEGLDPKTKQRLSEKIFMINCIYCGTALSCSQAFYDKLIKIESETEAVFEFRNFDMLYA